MLEGRTRRRSYLGKDRNAQLDGSKLSRYIHLSSTEQDNNFVLERDVFSQIDCNNLVVTSGCPL